MKKSLFAAASLAAAISSLPAVSVAAEEKKAEPPYTLTGNFGFASEYRYRGIAQTNTKPAVQGGFDFAHSSGFYAGTWASNISWLSDTGTASSSIEWDFYGGYKGTVGDFGYDVGGLYYYYPGNYTAAYRASSSKPDTFEVYAAGTWKWFTLKYSHSLTDTFGFKDSKGSGYLDLTGTFEIAEGTNVIAHIGNQVITGSTPNARSRSDCTYTDWKLGVTKDISGFVFGAAVVGTDAKGSVGQCYRNSYNKDLGHSTVVLSVVKNF